ncbi:hypothetical protein ACROYT_G039122 [Oculina patagonica]
MEGKDSILDGRYQDREKAIAKCAVAARKIGFKMFALQNGGWCATSATAEQTYNNYGKSNNCNADGEGGPWANHVYTFEDTWRICDVNAVCTNTLGSYNCSCKDGFYGDGKNCTDIDECANGTHSCDVNAVCNNIRGSYNCTCKDGFYGDGETCTDIDECANGTHSCDVNAVCNNTRGSYNCTCKDGFYGDGKTCDGCQDALGMESGVITDEQITASSKWNDYHAAVQGRLHNTEQHGSWSARTNDANRWLQIDLIGQYIVTRVATQGSNEHKEWVTKYKLQYGDDGDNFQYYRTQGQNKDKEFDGNTDKNTVVYRVINPPITARYIRFRPVKYHSRVSMRVELYGCKQGCQEALGMESRAIENKQITASSEDNARHLAIYGRLHFQEIPTQAAGAWVANAGDNNPWLQIDLGDQYTKLRGVGTQGRNSSTYPQWVTKYKLQFGDDGTNFQYYRQQGQTTDKEFVGNTDQNTVVYHALNPPITARYIRFVPVDYHDRISMRVELYGCTQVGWYYGHPGHSCKHIRDSGGSRGDGEYWIDPEKSKTPLKVFCDMTTDAGGWLLVSNLVIDNPSSPQLSVETSYHGIRNYHNNKTFLTKSAMTELRTHLNFTQLRFHCSKQQGRTFHVTTVANSTGEAVVQYFSGQTDDQPDACGSFVRMENDNSLLAGVCSKWGRKNDVDNIDKWGYQPQEFKYRLYDHAAFVAGLYHWMLTPGGSRWECDDYNVGVSSGDFWKVFVR